MSEIYDEYELPVNRKKRILNEISEIDALDSGEDVFLMSTTEKKKEEKKDEDVEVFDDMDDASSWMNTLTNLSDCKIKPSRKHVKDLFGSNKKKKKKKKNDTIDYNKEFEPEVALYNDLLVEQSKFVDSLQKKYDRMENMRASARGTSKFTTDLITNINDARQLATQLVEKKVAIKKTIADLEMKQKKELAAGVDGENLNNFAAEYLKNIMNPNNTNFNNIGDGGIRDVEDEDDFFDILDGANDDTRDSDVSAYLRYENRNVSISVLMNQTNFDDYDFVAQAEDGEILPDYPLPERTRLTVNTSTMIATDTYGKKYHVVFRE